MCDRPLYRIPLACAGAGLNSGTPLGVLAGAVDAAAEVLGGRVSAYHGGAAVANGAILELVSRADAACRSLRGGIRDAAEVLWEAASKPGGRTSREQRAAVYGLQFYAVEVARDLISQLYSRSSSAAFFRGHPLERAMRDIHAIAYGFEPLRPFEHSAGLTCMGHRPIAPGF